MRQYVRFSIAATIRGAIDIFYDRDVHVVTLWFTPDRAPEVDFKTIGDIEVDSEGFVHAPTGPGLGYEIDWDLVRRHQTRVVR